MRYAQYDSVIFKKFIYVFSNSEWTTGSSTWGALLVSHLYEGPVYLFPLTFNKFMVSKFSVLNLSDNGKIFQSWHVSDNCRVVVGGLHISSSFCWP